MICIIPARSGSKRLPGKNFMQFNGDPLYIRTVAQAAIIHIPSVVVGDSGWADYDIGRVKRYGVSFKCRPGRLAVDDASTWDVVKWANNGNADVVLLQVTSPLRTIEDIVGAVDLFHDKGVAVNATTNGKPNGAVYVRHADDLEPKKVLNYEIPAHRSVDIDTMDDFKDASKRYEEFFKAVWAKGVRA